MPDACCLMPHASPNTKELNLLLNTTAQRVGRFGLLAALSLVLGYFDRAIPLTMLLSGAVPGIKLGLANTVLLYAVYLMDWKSCVALMLAKVLLSGFLFGSMSAILYSLSGGALSLAVMLLVRQGPAGARWPSRRWRR